MTAQRWKLSRNSSSTVWVREIIQPKRPIISSCNCLSSNPPETSSSSVLMDHVKLTNNQMRILAEPPCLQRWITTSNNLLITPLKAWRYSSITPCQRNWALLPSIKRWRLWSSDRTAHQIQVVPSMSSTASRSWCFNFMYPSAISINSREHVIRLQNHMPSSFSQEMSLHH